MSLKREYAMKEKMGRSQTLTRKFTAMKRALPFYTQLFVCNY